MYIQILTSFPRYPHRPEQFPRCPGYDPLVSVGVPGGVVVLVFVTPQHGVGLTTPCLSVRHNTDVVPIYIHTD